MFGGARAPLSGDVGGGGSDGGVSIVRLRFLLIATCNGRSRIIIIIGLIRFTNDEKKKKFNSCVNCFRFTERNYNYVYGFLLRFLFVYNCSFSTRKLAPIINTSSGP